MSTELSVIYDIMKANKVFPSDHTMLTGDFGVEIETEVPRQNEYTYPRLKWWTPKKDGSLRDFGVEYVLKKPLNSRDLDAALEEFAGCDKSYNFRKDSISTSVHVHLNMLGETYLTLANFLTTYAMVENHLIRKSGPDRLSNLFCLPLCDAEGIVDQWVTMLSNVNKKIWGKVALNPERAKYSAMNLANISTLGTAESRSFRGETDIRVIREWVSTLDKIRQFAKRSGYTPVTILQLYKTYGASTFLDMVFEDNARSIKLGKTLDEQLTKSNLKYAAKLAAVTKDWSKFGILKQRPVYKEKLKGELDKLSLDKFGNRFDQVQDHERLVISEMFHRALSSQRVVDVTSDM